MLSRNWSLILEGLACAGLVGCKADPIATIDEIIKIKFLDFIFYKPIGSVDI